MHNRFYIEPASTGLAKVEISGEEHHHLARVRRMTAGQEVVLLDGKGLSARAVIDKVHRDYTELTILERASAAEPALRIVAAMAVFKPQRMDWAVEKACELGVWSVRPFIAARSPQGAARDLDANAARLERWRRIAVSASKQSGRIFIPVVNPVVEFEEMIFAATTEVRLLFHEHGKTEDLDAALAGGLQRGRGESCIRPAERAITRIAPANQEEAANAFDVLAAFGPEGGFTDPEIAAAVKAGFTIAGLGPRVLRAETAIVAGIAIISNKLGE